MRRALGWGGLLAGGVVLVGLGMFYAATRLDFADKWGSVVGALVALFSLPMTAYGIVLARREPKGRAGQAVTDTVAGGRLVQVRDVRGNLRVGAPPSVSPLAGAPAPAPAVDVSDSDSPEGQVVRRSRIGGAVHQIDGVGDDADIDR